jgi:hypothetical protein
MASSFFRADTGLLESKSRPNYAHRSGFGKRLFCDVHDTRSRLRFSAEKLRDDHGGDTSRAEEYAVLLPMVANDENRTEARNTETGSRFPGIGHSPARATGAREFGAAYSPMLRRLYGHPGRARRKDRRAVRSLYA